MTIRLRVIVEGRGEFTMTADDLIQFADEWDAWRYLSVDEWLNKMLTGAEPEWRQDD